MSQPFTAEEQETLDALYRQLCAYIADLPPVSREHWLEQARRYRDQATWWRTLGAELRALEDEARAESYERLAEGAPLPREYWLKEAGLTHD